MPEIDGRTLMMAIQAVDAKVNALSKQIDQTGEDGDVSHLEDAMLGYMKAATSLKAGYEEALKSTSNLPAYESLVGE